MFSYFSPRYLYFLSIIELVYDCHWLPYSVITKTICRNCHTHMLAKIISRAFGMTVMPWHATDGFCLISLIVEIPRLIESYSLEDAPWCLQEAKNISTLFKKKISNPHDYVTESSSRLELYSLQTILKIPFLRIRSVLNKSFWKRWSFRIFHAKYYDASVICHRPFLSRKYNCNLIYCLFWSLLVPERAVRSRNLLLVNMISSNWSIIQ